MTCENCGSDHDGSYGSGRFCGAICARGFSTKNKRIEINAKVSTKVSATLRHNGLVNYTKKPKTCKVCGGPFSYEQRTRIVCDSCLGTLPSTRTYKILVAPKCIVCGLDTKPDHPTCSHSCANVNKYRSYIRRWKDGLESGMSGEDSISSHLRRYMFEKYEHKCSRCGWDSVNVYSGKQPLEVDHIDGDHKNNSEENLTLICPNCHSLTPTYRSLNKGKGRLGRKRYCN